MTSVTGYLTDAVMNPMPVICTVVAIIAAVFAAIGEEKVNAIVYDILIVVVNILLLVSFYWFILGRVSLAADVYFIPVNYPAAEADTLHISIVGAVFYLVADIMMIVMAFIKKKK